VHHSAGQWLVTDSVTLLAADGGIAISAEEATAFEPPSSSLRITRLPDAMYMAYPGKVGSICQAMGILVVCKMDSNSSTSSTRACGMAIFSEDVSTDISSAGFSGCRSVASDAL
jgi:hypothetical protein